MSNLTTRVLVAVVAIPLIVAACYFGGFFFFAFTTVIIVLSVNEFYSMASTRGLEMSPVIGITGAGVLNAIVYSSTMEAAFEFLIIFIVLVLLSELARKRTDKVSGTFESVGGTIAGVAYIGLFGAMLTALRLRVGIEHVLPTDRAAGYYLILILATIWICDSAAYFVGKPFGKHKMSRFVSPNKSWEGAAAGLIFAVITVVVGKFVFLHWLSIPVALGTGFVVGIFGQAGDFVESLFKRDAGVKDSSDMIPGHGGVFDRFDSLIFSAPLIYLMLKHVQ